MTKKRMFVSVSSGKSSGLMAKMLLDEKSDEYDFLFVMANSTQEHNKSLVFADRCNREWGLGLVIVEAVVHHGDRKACTHRVVNYNSACRDGSVFEDVIIKYGVPNKAYPHCTRELKLSPMYSYVNSIWPDKDYDIAIGLRADEAHRFRKDAKEKRIIYPLAEAGIDKQDVNDWWEDQPFNLEIPEHLGNCVWCWKKSLKKHAAVFRDAPEAFDFTAKMEKLHGLKGHNVDGTKRVFFRGHMNTESLISEVTKQGTLKYNRQHEDEDGGCSESCDIHQEI